MTATPKIFKDVKQQPGTIETIAMNDEFYFGNNIFDYSYKAAVEGKYHTEPVLSQYEIIIAVIKTNDQLKSAYQQSGKKRVRVWNPSDETKCQVIAKELFKIGDAKEFPVNAEPMRRALFYTNAVRYSQIIAGKYPHDRNTSFVNIVKRYAQTTTDRQEQQKLNRFQIHVQHMDGYTPPRNRQTIIEEFKAANTNKIQIITNVEVLGEGVDVPALDAVVFVHPRRNKINIAQIAGRVFRKSQDPQKFPKQKGYIILPVVITQQQTSIDEEWEVNNSEFGEVKTLVTRMQEIDASLNVELSQDHWKRVRVRHYQKNEGGGDMLRIMSTDSDPLIQNIKAKILDRSCKIRQANFQNHLIKMSQKIQHEVYRLNKYLIQQPALYTEWRRLKAILINNLNADFKDDEKIRGFLIQHLIMRQVLQLATSNQWQPGKVYKLVDQFIKTCKKYNPNLQLKPQLTDTWGGSETTKFIKEIYQSIFTKLLPTEKENHGIYYTPVYVVDFMLKSVQSILKHHFNSGFNSRGNLILDPFAGTGSFLTRLCDKSLDLIATSNLHYKFTKELYAIEIQPLAYYGCRLNLEQTVMHRLQQDNLPTDLKINNILLGDAFTMYERQWRLDKKQQAPFGNFLNRISINQFNQVPINIVISNPPYGADGPLHKYQNLAANLKSKFKTECSTTNPKAINNLYLVSWFFSTQWVLRNKDEQAIVCLITPRSWLEGKTLDGVRHYFYSHFTALYIIDFPNSGQIFKNVKIQVAVTVLVLDPTLKKLTGFKPKVYYLKLNKSHKETKVLFKTNWLKYHHREWNIAGHNLLELEILDARKNWLIGAIDKQLLVTYKSFPVIDSFFQRQNTSGVKTHRNEWICNFSSHKIKKQFNLVWESLWQEKLNAHINWPDEYKNFKQEASALPKGFWSRDFYQKFINLEIQPTFKPDLIYSVFWYPFCKKKLYYSDNMVDRPRSIIKKNFSSNTTERFCLVVAIEKNKINPLVINAIPQEAFLGTNARVYINKQTPQFSGMFKNKLSKEFEEQVSLKDCSDFYYFYALLNNDRYQQQFSQVIEFEAKIHVPYVCDLKHPTDFKKLVNIGHKLTQLHLNYETMPPYQKVKIRVYQNKKEIEFRDYSLVEFLTQVVTPFSQEERYRLFRVKKMKFNEEKTILIFNEKLKIYNIPSDVYKWKIRENKSPLEWIVGQYKIKTYNDGTKFQIRDDPNDYCRELKDPAYLFNLVLRTITMSLKTIQIKNSYSIELQLDQKFNVEIKNSVLENSCQ